MPTYDYLCEACGHKFEEFQNITAEVLTKCPACKKKKLRRLFGIGAAVMFKGSGFYQTDYRSDSYKSAAAKDSKAGESKSTESKSGESKSSESKSGESKSSDSKASSSESKPKSGPKKNPSKGD